MHITGTFTFDYMLLYILQFWHLILDRMGLINRCPQTPVQGAPLYPTSSNILPPTPTQFNQQTNAHLECVMTEQQPSDDSKVRINCLKNISFQDINDFCEMNNIWQKKNFYVSFAGSIS